MFDSINLIKCALGFYPKDPKFYSKYPLYAIKNKKSTEEQKAEAIKSTPSIIMSIKNPSLYLKKIALDQDLYTWFYIEDKSDIWDYFIDKYGASPLLSEDNIPERIQIKMFKSGFFLKKPCKQVQHLMYDKFGITMINSLRIENGICNSLQKRAVEDYVKYYKYNRYLNDKFEFILNDKNKNYLSKLLMFS